MRFLNEKQDFEITGKSTYSSTVIYKLESRNELKGLLNKFGAVRILYNGKDAYAWQADMLDHHTVKEESGFLDDYFGFMIDHKDNDSILQGWEKNPNLVDKFKKQFM